MQSCANDLLMYCRPFMNQYKRLASFVRPSLFYMFSFFWNQINESWCRTDICNKAAANHFSIRSTRDFRYYVPLRRQNMIGANLHYYVNRTLGVLMIADTAPRGSEATRQDDDSSSSYKAWTSISHDTVVRKGKTWPYRPSSSSAHKSIYTPYSKFSFPTSDGYIHIRPLPRPACLAMIAVSKQRFIVH